ncbi:MAG: 3-phosphoserine/phosphohydroxythreonine aminotransferase [Gammaproteobacteria bacterium]|nr:MAG: 3-phosphoserine/phosphohydroxythreonine aminotransferase [Gammaproteobacteria bacterium]
MSRVYNFSAGPAALPTEVLAQAQAEMLDWNNTGVSVMEMSHRGKDYMSIAAKAEANLRQLMMIPDNYKVLFVQGGASSQFAMVPINLLNGKKSADYLLTGQWSKKAVAEVKRYCHVNVVADTTNSHFTTVPAAASLEFDPDAAYVHYTPNETIVGVEFDYIPETGDVPLVADMSSTILSRAIDVSKFGVIYAGAQKNIGPAGLTIVIVREDLIGNADANMPVMFDYKTFVDYDSMYNTPPTYSWYFAGLVFAWGLKQGGMSAIEATNKRKAEKLYKAIDDSAFYSNPVDVHCRSWMNVPFILADANLDTAFIEQAAAKGLTSLKGHRSVGGMRASIYNAMPEVGVDALIAFMKDFEKTQA